MCFVAAVGVVGVVVGGIIAINYSDYSDHSERRWKKAKAKLKKIDRSKENLEDLIRDELSAFMTSHGLDGKLPEWKAEESNLMSFDSEFTQIDAIMKNKIKNKIASDLHKEIEADMATIRELDKLIVKINKVTLM